MQEEKILKNTEMDGLIEFKKFEIRWVRLNLRSFWISSSNICKQYSFTKQNTRRIMGM